MKTVMIVDDEIMVRVGMKAIINWEENGYTIIADCSDGTEAMAKIAQQVPDLILTDLKMDKMDGFALIEACKEKYPTIRFMILSNYNDFENTKKAIQLGAIDYIFKLTVTPQELIKALENAASHLVARQDKTDRFLRKNATAIKAYLIKVAAEGSYSDEAAMQEDLREVCPASDFTKPYCVLQISIDAMRPESAGNSLRDLQLLKYGMENMIAEVMNQDIAAEVYNYFREDFIVVFNTQQLLEATDPYAYVKKKFEVMREYMHRYFSLAITGALSKVYTGLAQLRCAVEETNRVLMYRVESECGILHTAGEKQRPEIMRIRQYIHAHMAENLCLEIAAREVNMSASYFSHLFKEEMKLSFTDYVNRIRMQRACQLLKNENLKIHEVAAQVGIDNFNYFSVLFKKTTGFSPNAYREQLAALEQG